MEFVLENGEKIVAEVKRSTGGAHNYAELCKKLTSSAKGGAFCITPELGFKEGLTVEVDGVEKPMTAEEVLKRNKTNISSAVNKWLDKNVRAVEDTKDFKATFFVNAGKLYVGRSN